MDEQHSFLESSIIPARLSTADGDNAGLQAAVDVDQAWTYYLVLPSCSISVTGRHPQPVGTKVLGASRVIRPKVEACLQHSSAAFQLLEHARKA